MVAENSKVRRSLGRRVEDFLELLAKAHVEHLVGLVEHDDAKRGQVERAALQMIAKPARRADDDMRAALQRAALLHRVHAADAGDDAGAGGGVEPLQLLADLDRKLAGRRDHQAERLARPGRAVAFQQLAGDGEAEGDGLARAGLRGNDQVAAIGLVLDDRRLDRGQRVIAARGQRFRERGVNVWNVAWRQRLLAIGAER